MTTWSSAMAIWSLAWPLCARFQPLTSLCVPATLGCIWQNLRSPITLLLVTELQVKLDSVMSVHWLPDPTHICLFLFIFSTLPQRSDCFSVVYSSQFCFVFFIDWSCISQTKINKLSRTLIISGQMLVMNDNWYDLEKNSKSIAHLSLFLLNWINFVDPSSGKFVASQQQQIQIRQWQDGNKTRQQQQETINIIINKITIKIYVQLKC